MKVIDDLLASLPPQEAALRDVRVGPFWTVVWTERGAGLASTQRDARTPHGHSLIRWAGDLMEHNAHELAGLLRARSPMEAALGMAAANALLEVDEALLTDRNASEEIIRRGNGKRVVIVGHFPFIPKVRKAVGHLDVLELDPGPGEMASTAAAEVIPRADVVAITGTSLVNKTFDKLIQQRKILDTQPPPKACDLGIQHTLILKPPMSTHGIACHFPEIHGVEPIAARGNQIYLRLGPTHPPSHL